jgi:hypothetical protein
MKHIVQVNSKAVYSVDDDIPSDIQHKAIVALIEFIQTFDDRKIDIGCVFDDVMGGLRIINMSLGNIAFYGFTGDDDEVLVIATAQHVAEAFQYEHCFREQTETLKRLLTTC